MQPEDAGFYKHFVIPQTKCMGCCRHRDRVPGKTVCHECWQKVSDALTQPQKPSIPTKKTAMTRTKENFERVLAALQQAEQEAIDNGTYKLPSRNQLGVSLELEDYFYNGTINGKKATTAYNEAQTRLTLKRIEAEGQESGVRSQESTSTPTTVSSPLIPPSPHSPDPYRLKLEAENTRLRAEIDALRVQQATPTGSDRTLLQALKDEDQKLRGEADALLLQIDALQRQHQRLLTEANAIQRLIEQREGAIEQLETAVVTVAATNGHRQLAGVTR